MSSFSKKSSGKTFRFVPATAERWNDLAELFGERGACGGCWCMTWRKSRQQYNQEKGEGNRRSLKKLVEAGLPPGVLAYVGKTAVGWCSVAPREEFVYLQRSRLFRSDDEKSDDEKKVWAISCLFVAKGYRKQGVSVGLVEAAAKLAKKYGARAVEAFPQDLKDPLPDAFVWTGVLPSFTRAGFKVVRRPSPKRPVVRMEF